MLTSSASSPIFLRCDEGMKWLVRLFSWPSLIEPLHKEIRLAIPECTHAQSAKYGEIYFKAWKVSQGDAKKVSATLKFQSIGEILQLYETFSKKNCKIIINLSIYL